MSQMLEQAIVDADALKEAALKNAEQSVIEKYSSEIKNVMEKLLEQGEDDFAGLGPAPDAPVEDSFPDLPRADMEGEELCPCPDDEEEVEIDFDALAKQLAAEEEAEMVDREDFIEDEFEEPLMENVEEKDELKEDDEEDDITEEIIANVLEELEVDIKNVPTGQAGGASNATIDKDNKDIALAAEAQEEELEELDEDEESENLKEELKILKQNKEKLEEQHNKLIEQNTQFLELLPKLKEKLEEISFSNAKLLYTNKTLTSTSLNERQKTKIVEAINKVNSVEEAKIVFETLHSTVGSTRKRRTKSLSEAVARPSTALPRRNEAKKSDPISTRWKTLAGIK